MGDHSAWWVDDHSAWVGKEVEDHFKVYLITVIVLMQIGLAIYI